jgi:hypothetical protein
MLNAKAKHALAMRCQETAVATESVVKHRGFDKLGLNGSFVAPRSP